MMFWHKGGAVCAVFHQSPIANHQILIFVSTCTVMKVAALLSLLPTVTPPE